MPTPSRAEDGEPVKHSVQNNSEDGPRPIDTKRSEDRRQKSYILVDCKTGKKMITRSIVLSVVAILCGLAGTTLQGQEQLFINELQADNTSTIIDESDQAFDDWIELFNAGDAPIELSGYYLSDDAEEPMKWALPDLSIPGGGFLLVWADGDTKDEGLHADFGLSKNGEFLGLYRARDSEIETIDALTFGALAADLSYGRTIDGGGIWQTLAQPTPGMPNINTPGVDPSDQIFGITRVNNFDLHFYVDGWADSLRANYENGELYMPAQVRYGTMVFDSVGVRYKGNSSYQLARSTPKKPLKIKFDKYRDEQVFYGVKTLNFSNCVKDPSFMRETIGYALIGNYMPAPRTAYANISIDGALLGLYVQVEQIDKTFLARHFADNDFNLYKAGDDGATLLYRGSGQEQYEAELELKTNEDENDWSALLTMIETLNTTPAQDFAATMSDYLDLEQCTRHLAFTMLLSHFDSYTGSGRNFYLYDDKAAGRFTILPWDLNECFGAYSNGWDVIRQDLVDVPDLAQRPLNQRILADASLKQAYLRSIQTMLDGPASYDAIAAMVEDIRPLIDEYVSADDNKLYSYQQFRANIDEDVFVGLGMRIPGILSFLRDRSANLRMQLAAYTETSLREEATEFSPIALEAWPNPFKTITTLFVRCSEAGMIKLNLFNSSGTLVATIADTFYPAGEHRISFDGRRLAAGVYHLRAESSEGVSLHSLLLSP